MTKKKKKEKKRGKVVDWWKAQPIVPKTDPRWMPSQEKTDEQKGKS
jgi:hypothetical protein